MISLRISGVCIEFDLYSIFFIGDVKAIDEDRSDSITYSIQSDNLLQLFSIDSLSGEVWSRHMSDR